MSDAVGYVFASNVETTLAALKAAGLKVAIISDIDVDIRPAFSKRGLDVYVDQFVLSFEHSVSKPDPAILRVALSRLGVQPEEALMVGDRSSHDGAAVEAGFPTLLAPQLTKVTDAKPLIGQSHHKIISIATRGFTLVTCVATLDVPRHVVEYLSRLLAAHRRRIGTPQGS